MNSVVEGTSLSPDPLLGENSIHWLICLQTYNRNRSPNLPGGWFLGYDGEETCVYHKEDAEGFVLPYSIIGFRGTTNQKDILDDIKLSLPENGTCGFPRAQEGIDFTRKFIDDNPELTVQVTGHSLGGAIARCAGQALGLGIITFNAAAPPSNPVDTSSGNEQNYHIVFDIISAWQSPGTIRIDKGYRPKKNRSLIPLVWAKKALGEVYESHSLVNFSNQRPGNLMNSEQENSLMKSWFYSLPSILRKFIIFFLMGTTKKFTTKLPEIK